MLSAMPGLGPLKIKPFSVLMGAVIVKTVLRVIRPVSQPVTERAVDAWRRGRSR